MNPAIFIVIVFFCLVWAHLASRKVWKKRKDYITKLLLPSIAILVTVTIPVLDKDQLSPDYQDLNRPYLITELEILDITPNAFFFRFNIENVGELPAKDVAFSFYTSNTAFQENGITGRSISPGESMEYKPLAYLLKNESQNLNYIVLTIHYKGVFNNDSIGIKESFNFEIHSSAIKLGFKIRPFNKKDESAFQKEYNYSFVSQSNMDSLDMPVGSIIFGFRKEDQPENTVLLKGGINKKILYFPKDEEVMFLTEFNNGDVIKLTKRINPGQEIHAVIASWDEKERWYLLAVDGVIIQNKPRPEKATE